MSPSTAPAVEAHELRAELKEWEHEFVAVHGQKPGRKDIKANRDMAAKYKLYDKLTRPSSNADSKSKAVASTPSPSRKRKRDVLRDSGVGIFDETNVQATTDQLHQSPPRSSLKADGTVHPSTIDPYDPPLNALFSPFSSTRSVIGPTPQKNGRVLGIFDLLSPESAYKNTPSRRNGLSTFDTPSRSRVSQLDLLSGTPSRRNVLTPSRNRVNTLAAIGATPSHQRTKPPQDLGLDETPECLKRFPRKNRHPTPPPTDGVDGGENEVGDDGADGLMNITWSPVAVRQPRRRFGRSFSELAKDLKRREEQKMDDELDILREMEEEMEQQQRALEDGAEMPIAKKARSGAVAGTQSEANPSAGHVTGKSQAGDDLPLGPDGERAGEHSDIDEAVQENQTRGRKWKRKGPKRQTKKFNIRPNHHAKFKPEPEWKAGIDKDSDDDRVDAGGEAAQDADIVPETQVARKPRNTATAAGSDGEASDFLESEDELLASEHDEPKRKTATKKDAKATADTKTKDAKETKKKAEKIAKPKKKISATAHANYRTLNIKNKHSKGKGKGRFGRGRR